MGVSFWPFCFCRLSCCGVSSFFFSFSAASLHPNVEALVRAARGRPSEGERARGSGAIATAIRGPSQSKRRDPTEAVRNQGHGLCLGEGDALNRADHLEQLENVAVGKKHMSTGQRKKHGAGMGIGVFIRLDESCTYHPASVRSDDSLAYSPFEGYSGRGRASIDNGKAQETAVADKGKAFEVSMTNRKRAFGLREQAEGSQQQPGAARLSSWDINSEDSLLWSPEAARVATQSLRNMLSLPKDREILQDVRDLSRCDGFYYQQYALGTAAF